MNCNLLNGKKAIISKTTRDQQHKTKETFKTQNAKTRQLHERRKHK